jgi:hypothetical protein
MCVALALRLPPWSGPEPPPMPSSTPEKFLMLYARSFPIRRGKFRVVNSLWRAAVGDQSTHRLAALNHVGLKMSCILSEML